MEQVAKLFANGRSQAVRLPAALRFDASEVFVRQDKETGDIVLSRRPSTWDGFFEALKGLPKPPAGFLGKQERKTLKTVRDPFAGWTE